MKLLCSKNIDVMYIIFYCVGVGGVFTTKIYSFPRDTNILIKQEWYGVHDNAANTHKGLFSR
jgi:hypothetical protein